MDERSGGRKEKSGGESKLINERRQSEGWGKERDGRDRERGEEGRKGG